MSKASGWSLLVVAMIWFAMTGFFVGRRSVSCNDEQSWKSRYEEAESTLEHSPYARVVKLNVRYHELLIKHGIDPKKEGVYDQ